MMRMWGCWARAGFQKYTEQDLGSSWGKSQVEMERLAIYLPGIRHYVDTSHMLSYFKATKLVDVYIT